MRSLKPHQRLIIFLLCVLALTSILTPWFAVSADWMAGQQGWLPERYPFGRIFNRTFMISGILLFFLCRPLLAIGRPAELGLTRFASGKRDLAMGWLLALASMAGLAAVMTLFDVFTPYFRLPAGESVERCVKAFFAGAFAGSLEEIFFRGILFKSLYAQGPLRAYLGANLFYSLIHFVKPGAPYFMERFDLWAGWRHLAYTFTPFLDPAPLMPGIFGLFLLGVILSFAFARTGNLYLAIGLHAGWVFALKSLRVFGNYTREDLGWMFGATEPKVISGVFAWVGILLVALLVYWMTRGRKPRLGAPLAARWHAEP